MSSSFKCFCATCLLLGMALSQAKWAVGDNPLGADKTREPKEFPTYTLAMPITADSIKLPGGSAGDLLDYANINNINRLANDNKLSNLVDYLKLRGYIAKLVGDKVAVDPKATEKQKAMAELLSLQGLTDLSLGEGKQYVAEFKNAVTKLRKDKPGSSIAHYASAFEFRANYLFGTKLKKDTGDQLIKLAKAEPKNPLLPQMFDQVLRLIETHGEGNAVERFLQGIVTNFPNDPRIPIWNGLLLRQAGQTMAVAGTTLTGTPIDSAAWKGKVVLIDFWATWCGPCTKELPNLQDAFKKLHGKGFEIIGVSLDDNNAKALEFVKEHDVPWPSILDSAGIKPGEMGPLAKKYGVTEIPALVLIGRDGKIVKAQLFGEGALEKAVEAELAKPTPTQAK